MTNIQWTDKTWNPVIGCTPVSPGCLNCYAATMARRLEAMGKKEYAPRVVHHPERQAMPDAFGVRTIPARTETIRIAEVKGGRAVFTGEVRCLEDRLAEPLRWKKPARIFVNSMSDLFHEAVPFEFIDRIFAVMALCPQHRFQVLTKRPERMAEYLGDEQAAGMGHRIAQHAREMVGRTPLATWVTGRVERARDYFDEHEGILPNVALGASAEDQARLDERVPHLLRCPAAVRFLSLEPLLGEIDVHASLRPQACNRCLSTWYGRDAKCPGCFDDPCAFATHGTDVGVDYIIVGGESGPGARPCDIAWIRSIVKQCKGAGVPCFVKQVGAAPMVGDLEDGIPWTEAGARVDYENETGRITLRDRKGGEPAEWPRDLRVRDPWPDAARGHS